MIKTAGFKNGDGMRGFKKKVQNAFRFGPADPDDPYTANTGGGGNGGYRIFKHYIIAGLKDRLLFMTGTPWLKSLPEESQFCGIHPRLCFW